jgi:hypothetical protein
MLRLVALLVLLATPAWAAGCPVREPARNQGVIAREIAKGHAFEKHKGEYRSGQIYAGTDYALPPIRTEEQFADLVTRNLLQPDAERALERGRRAFWEEDFGGLVIFDPNNPDCGTAFRPRRGKAYFDDLR